MLYMQRLPRTGDDQAWALEHTFHFYGTPVPLMRNFRDGFEIFEAGGLLFFMRSSSLEECSVAHPDVPLSALTGCYLGGIHLPPHEAIRRDMTTYAYVINLLLTRWLELLVGRNRWMEAKQRGADVDVDAWLRKGLM